MQTCQKIGDRPTPIKVWQGGPVNLKVYQMAHLWKYYYHFGGISSSYYPLGGTSNCLLLWAEIADLLPKIKKIWSLPKEPQLVTA